MPYQLLRDSLMPRVVGLCLRTTSLVVRTSSLTLMAQAAHRLDKEAAATMLDVCVQVGMPATIIFANDQKLLSLVRVRLFHDDSGACGCSHY